MIEDCIAKMQERRIQKRNEALKKEFEREAAEYIGLDDLNGVPYIRVGGVCCIRIDRNPNSDGPTISGWPCVAIIDVPDVLTRLRSQYVADKMNAETRR